MNSLIQKVVDQLIEQIETGTGQWQKSWTSAGGLPSNAVTKNNYQGMNVLFLWVSQMNKGYSSSQWATLKQLHAAGYRIKDDEVRTNTPIVFYKMNVSEKNGEKTTYPIMRCSWVFNADQVEGFQKPEPKIVTPNERHLMAMHWLSQTGINMGQGEPAFSPLADKVYMPDASSFNTLDDYWTTLFHEAVHWTGHSSRLKREMKVLSQDREAYALEELVAEIGASFLDAHFGITSTTLEKDHGAYLRHWLQHMPDKRRAIYRASTMANKAFQFLNPVQTEELAEAA